MVREGRLAEVLFIDYNCPLIRWYHCYSLLRTLSKKIMNGGRKNMKKKIVGICTCMLVIAAAFPAVGILNRDIEKNAASYFPPGIDWMKTYGGEEFNWLYDIKLTDDGYIAGGVFEYQNRMCAWMLKTDKNGNETWSNVNDLWFGTSPVNQDIGVQCVLPVDDGFLASGYGLYNDTSDTVVGYIWKVNLTGVTQWLKALGNETEMWSVSPFRMEIVDDEIICGGWIWQMTTPPEIELDAAWFKIDLDGNLNESSVHNYDVGGWDWVRSLWRTTDGGYFLSGSTEEPNPSVENSAYFMIKTDSNGNKEWEKIFDGPGEDYAATSGCRQTSDGGYIMCGHSNSWSDGDLDLWVVKTDAMGTIILNKTYGGDYDDHCYGMDAIDNGYVFVVVKNAWMTTGTKEDLLIIETDTNGKVTWEFELFEEGTQWLQTIHQIEDKGFIIAGRSGILTSQDCSGLIMEITPFPKLDFDIKSGLGITVNITNSGTEDATNILWEINVKGGILGMINKTKSGYITVPSDTSKTVSTGVFFGLGPITITAKIAYVEKTANGTQIIIFSMVDK